MSNIIMEDTNCWEVKFESCSYSSRLLDKLQDINEKAKDKSNLLEIKKAIYYAKKYHGEQKRQSGEPYYSHPIEVAYMLSDYLFRTDIIVTAILHDTIEDTDLTFEMIKSIFGEVVANQVRDLTRIKEDGQKISSPEMVELLFKQKKYDLLLIKLFDRLHNMQAIRAKSPEKRYKIAKETVSTFIVLAAYLNITEVEEKITHLCAEYIGLRLDVDCEIPFGGDKHLLSLIFQNDLDHK